MFIDQTNLTLNVHKNGVKMYSIFIVVQVGVTSRGFS